MHPNHVERGCPTPPDRDCTCVYPRVSGPRLLRPSIVDGSSSGRGGVNGSGGGCVRRAPASVPLLELYIIGCDSAQFNRLGAGLLHSRLAPKYVHTAAPAGRTWVLRCRTAHKVVVGGGGGVRTPSCAWATRGPACGRVPSAATKQQRPG
jgi:hypothetical protein